MFGTSHTLNMPADCLRRFNPLSSGAMFGT